MNTLAVIGDAARRLVRRLLRIYYAHLVVEGRERIPAGEPVLFVANHPNSLVDPALIGFTAQRPVHFFAKAPLFDVPGFGAVMRALGMVPAYRGQDDPAAVRRNLETLDLGARYLARGEAVGIFPEGKSHDREGVEQVRTGAARIAVSALAGGARLWIVPLGLNYERKERFRSSVWVRVGEPLDVRRFLAEHGAEERRLVRALTTEIDLRLKQVAVHLEPERWENVLHELEVLLPAEGAEASDPVAALRQRKRIADAMNHFFRADAARAEHVAAALEQHQHRLAGFGLDVASPVVQWSGGKLTRRMLRDTLWLLPGLLPALAGTLHHLVPFLTTRGLVRLVRYPGRTTLAQNRFLLGLPVYGVWYALVAWLLTRQFAPWVAVSWTLLMPFAGVAALHYAWRMRHAGRAWWNSLRMLARRGALRHLRAEQARLGRLLRELRREYLAHSVPETRLSR